jgi:2,5-dioxopentanoate dehydrogenase
MDTAQDTLAPILVDGEWQVADAVSTYRAVNPATGEAFGESFAVSSWADVDAVLTHAQHAGPFADAPDRAAFLERYAELIEQSAAALAAVAETETGLPAEGRFKNVEIPRTCNQLRQAAAAARSRNWQNATIDTKLNIRSCLGSIGPVVIFGPANFPFAYNAIAGGDFASAIAAGNVVVGRAHPSHPNTTYALARLLMQAAHDVGLAVAPAHLLFGFSNEDGLRLARDRRIAAIGFTGSRHGGLALKASADSAGIPFYGELSSINPLVITPEALDETFDAIVDQYLTSVLMGGGQFCTNPGIVFLVEAESTHRFIDAVVARFREVPAPVLLNEGVVKGLTSNVQRLKEAGAQLLVGGTRPEGKGFRFSPTALKTTDTAFGRNASVLQSEMFGPACLLVVCQSMAAMSRCLQLLEGNLCGAIYLASHQTTSAEAIGLSQLLRSRVGRLLNDKMPTGVAVTSAMNHGGPYPSTGHAGFTAVGFPASIRRFGKLDCYDNVRAELLPLVLRDENAAGAWRLIDGEWTREPIRR